MRKRSTYVSRSKPKSTHLLLRSRQRSSKYASMIFTNYRQSRINNRSSWIDDCYVIHISHIICDSRRTNIRDAIFANRLAASLWTKVIYTQISMFLQSEKMTEKRCETTNDLKYNKTANACNAKYSKTPNACNAKTFQLANSHTKFAYVIGFCLASIGIEFE